MSTNYKSITKDPIIILQNEWVKLEIKSNPLDLNTRGRNLSCRSNNFFGNQNPYQPTLNPSSRVA
jgi:hypothetical protein